jgi:heme-binding protein
MGLILLAVAAAVVVQFVRRPVRTNPATDPARALTAQVAVPPHIATTLDRACGDCHSHQTRWPWYSRVAPASWLVVEHVDHGRRHLNFSDWTAGGQERAQEPLNAICQEVTSGRMPLPSYLWLHPQARLSPAEVQALCGWTSSARSARDLRPAGASAAGPDGD